MDVLVGFYPPALRWMLDALILAAIIGFCGFASIQAWRIVKIMAANGQVSITAEIPMTVPYAAFVVGFAMIVLAAIAELIARRFDPMSKMQDGSNH